MPTSDIKALLIHAAYTGAVAVCEPLSSNPDGTQVKLDPLVQDIGLQQKDLLVYEVAKIHYHAILRAFHDKSGIWPDPQVTDAAGAAPASANLAAIAKTAGSVAHAVAPMLPGSELGNIVEAAGKVADAVAGATKGTNPGS